MFGVQKILAIWKKFCRIFSVIPSFLYENGLLIKRLKNHHVRSHVCTRYDTGVLLSLLILAAVTDSQNVILVLVSGLHTSLSWISWLRHIDLLPHDNWHMCPCYYSSIMLRWFWHAIAPIVCSALSTQALRDLHWAFLENLCPPQWSTQNHPLICTKPFTGAITILGLDA